MSNSHPEIRSITNRTELETVYDLLGNVFPVGRDFFQQRLDHDSAYEFSTTWIAMQQEMISSTVQVFPFNSRVENASIKIGGLGSVATLPAFQGKGHCKQILHHLTEWMEQQEYDLCQLFAIITPFYEKLGWSIVPENSYELDTTSIPSISPNFVEIIPFDSSHLTAVSEIHQQFNDNRTYTAIRSSSFWQDQIHFPRWKAAACLLAIKDGAVVAYGLISKLNEDGSANLEELCYQKGEESAVIPLFDALVKERPQAVRIVASLPDDHALLDVFTSWGAIKKTMNHAMWRVIRFQPMLAKLSSVFQNRLRDSKEYTNENVKLCFECDGKKAYLHYIDGDVTIEPDPHKECEYSSFQFTQKEFVASLLQGYGESSHTAEHNDILSLLFPKQNSGFYNLDKY